MKELLKSGDTVTIMNQTLSGKKIREGDAILIKCLNPNYGLFDDHISQLWVVRFLEDDPSCTCTRQVIVKKPPKGCGITK